MIKRFLVLALLGASLLAAKTYTFAVPDPIKAGAAQLKPGEYSLKVEGSQVVLMDQNGRRIEAAAKLQASDRKFLRTEVMSTSAGGANRIESVGLEGSNNMVVFQ